MVEYDKNSEEYKNLYNEYRKERTRFDKDELIIGKNEKIKELSSLLDERINDSHRHNVWIMGMELKQLEREFDYPMVTEKERDEMENRMKYLKVEIEEGNKTITEDEKVEFQHNVLLNVYNDLLLEKRDRKKYIAPEVEINIYQFDGKKIEFAQLVNDIYNRIHKIDKRTTTKDKRLLTFCHKLYSERAISSPRKLAELMLEDFKGTKINDYRLHKDGFEKGLTNLVKMMTDRCDNWYTLHDK